MKMIKIQGAQICCEFPKWTEEGEVLISRVVFSEAMEKAAQWGAS
jgi:hypothetical protein